MLCRLPLIPILLVVISAWGISSGRADPGTLLILEQRGGIQVTVWMDPARPQPGRVILKALVQDVSAGTLVGMRRSCRGSSLLWAPAVARWTPSAAEAGMDSSWERPRWGGFRGVDRDRETACSRVWRCGFRPPGCGPWTCGSGFEAGRRSSGWGFPWNRRPPGWS